jgi:hypothetical protein
MSTSRRARRLRLLAALGTLAALAVVSVGPAAAGTGLGAIFNLGKTNTVNSVSTLKGATSTRLLQVTQTGNGAGLQITTKLTAPPLKVNSSVKVDNLNADKVDGLNADALMAPGDITRATIGGWLPRYSSTGYVFQSEWETGLRSTASDDTVTFGLRPESPVVENGWQYGIKSVHLCINGTSLAQITDITLFNISLADSGVGYGGTLAQASDTGVPRTSGGCADITLPSVYAGGLASVNLTAHFDTSSGGVSITDVTFHWVPVAKAP